ncbi:hypothetical protein AAC387_Pa08g0222 [Persea americana]
MSLNQSRTEKSEAQVRRPGRPGNSSQQRNFAGGGGKGGGGGVSAPPLSSPGSSSSVPSLSTNRSFKRSSNGQGGQSRMGGASLNSESNVAVSNARITQNGAHAPSQLHDAPASGVAKRIDSSVSKSSRALPKAPSSQPGPGSGPHSEFATPVTPSKGDVSKAFPLQFGSISPGFMNGMQIPARTSSAPPNLDEQKRDQARNDSSKAMPTLPIPSSHKAQQLKKNVSNTNQPNIVESHPPSQANRDAQVQILAGSVATTTQKSTTIPIAGISMPMPYQQPAIPLQFGAPGAQMQSQGVTTSSLQIPRPLPVGNTTQVQQQVFVSGLQPHPLQPQGMLHQGQSLGFAPQMGHQMGNLGMGMASPFAPQQPGKFVGTRKAVKITHPDTHEELKLDKRADSYSDVGSSGPRSHPNVTPQSQPIQSFSPAHSMGYYPTIPANSYNQSMYYSNPTSVPLTSTQMTPGSSATRYNYPVGQGGPPISFMFPSVSKAGPPVHGVIESSNLEHGRDGYMVSASAPSASVRVTVKPAVKPLAEKVMTPVTVSSPVSKGESPKLMRQPGEASASNQQIDNDVCSKQPKSLSEISDSMPLTVSIKHSTHSSAPVSLHGLPSSTSSVPTTPAEVSATVATKADVQRREPFKKSDSLKDQQRKPGNKEPQLSEQQHQVNFADSANRSNSPFIKLSGDVSPSDLNVEQASKNPDNLQPPSERVAEPTTSSSTPRNLECNVSFSSETGKGNALSSLESSGMSLEASEELSQEAHAARCDASATLADGVLDGEGRTSEPSNPSGLTVGETASEKSDTLLRKEKDGHVSLGVGLKQETTVTENSVTAIADGSLHDGDNSEVHAESTIVSESASDKQTEVVLQHVAIPENAEEMNVFGESKSCDSEVGRPVDNLVTSSSTGASSVSIDGTAAPPSHMSLADALEEKTSFIPSSKTDGEEVSLTGSGILSRETTTAAPSALSEMTRKHEGRGVESTSGGQTSTSSLVSKDKIPREQNKIKSTPGKKKIWKELLLKADAAGITSDLYLAYKVPEEKHETSITSESMDSAAADENGACVERDTVTAEDGQNKSELDDWEDAAEIPTPKLKKSENGELVDGATKPDDEYEGGVTGQRKYTRDFLLTFSDQFNDLPSGFEIGPDMVDALMSGHVAASHLVDRDSYLSSGRIIDRASGGSRNDRRGSSIVDDDKWGKAPGSFGSGRDPRMDGTHGGMAVNFRPGQAGNHGVLRNPRGQSSGQYVGGILSGPMQALASPGGMARNSPDVDRWQRAKGLIPAPPTPLQAMHKAERKYEIGKVSDREENKQRQLKAILNKLTPQNFDKLFQQVKEVNIDSVATLTRVISQIFDKALMEPTFCEMYANFCHHLAGALPDFSKDNEKITFKRLLLNKCQEEFERGEREQAEANRVEEGEITQSAEEREEKRVKARRRMLGNIRLIGELYNKKMLTERIMHECIKKLLGQYQNPDEEDIEALCKLMSTIGEMIDHPKAKEHMDTYFDVMLKLSNNQKLSSRVRFMLKDAIDLRKNKWQQRRKIEGPKKIEEVHRDAAQERQLQTSRLSRSGSGISSIRRGTPIDYGPRGSTTLSSSNAQQMSVPRSLPPQLRGYGIQDVRLEDRHSHESKMLSIPLPQRPIDDDSITLGPQGGLARGMSIRGQPLMPSAPLDVSTTGDPRRMASGPNGCSPASEWAHYNSREEPMQRYMPERFMATPGYEQSNSLERNRSFGSRDFRNVDRSFDRSMAAPPATGRVQGSTSGAQNVPFESNLSEDHLRNMSISTIREYYSARNEEEVRLCIKELHAPSFYPDMIMLWVADSFDRKNEIDRELLAKLLVNLCKSRDGLLSQVQLIKGFETVLATLEEAVTDSPKAAEYLGRILGKVISENAVPLREIGRIILDGGEEPGRLKETGLASDVLVSIFEFLKGDRGDTILSEMWRNSNLRLEEFRHPDPIKSRRLDAFM